MKWLTLSEMSARGLAAPSSPALRSRALRALSQAAQSPFWASTRTFLASELEPPDEGSPLPGGGSPPPPPPPPSPPGPGPGPGPDPGPVALPEAEDVEDFFSFLAASVGGSDVD